eukprot:14606495-Ditylum_brightwellii.AAC.1
MSSRWKGKCCAKELCKHEKLESCPQHKCSVCKGIPNKSEKQCSSCGGYGHERKSSILYHCYGKKRPQKYPPSDTTVMGGAENKSISRPNVTHVKYKKEPRYKPVIDISSPLFSPCDTEFHITKRNDCTGRKETLEPTPEVLLDHWFPLWLIKSFLKSRNHYRS